MNISVVINAQEKNCYSNKIFNLLNFEKKIELGHYKEKTSNNEIIEINNDSITSIFKISGFKKKLNIKRYKKLKIEKIIAYSTDNGLAEYLYFITYNLDSDIY